MADSESDLLYSSCSSPRVAAACFRLTVSRAKCDRSSPERGSPWQIVIKLATLMARTEQSANRVGAFFLATLLLWLVSILFEILFNRRTELISVVAGCLFFQTANWVIRYCISRDPLFVNTSVSLLHSTITSASGSHTFPLLYFPFAWILLCFSFCSICDLRCSLAVEEMKSFLFWYIYTS